MRGGDADSGVVEQYGVEAIPARLRTAGVRDLFGIAFTFTLTPLNYVLGAIAVTAADLPLWWAAAAIGLGAVAGVTVLLVVGCAGVDYGLPGQVAMRGTFGILGARLLTSPYRLIAATYWFAAQALAGGLGIQALLRGLLGEAPPLVALALSIAVLQAILAALGFDALRYVVRLLLPLMIGFTGVLVGLLVASDDPRYAVSRVLGDDSGRELTWAGLASMITVMAGAQLTNVTSIADFFRYGASRRAVATGFFAGAVTGCFVTAWVGAYAATASGELNPFVAVPDVTGSLALLAIMLVAIFAQTTAVNIMNIYSGGLSLVNAAPRLGRFRSTVAVGVVGVAFAGLPDLVNQAADWITHLGNVGTPLAGVILADYALLKRMRLDVPALYEPAGRYRYLAGLNPAAIAATLAAVAVYYVVDDAWLKAAWGVGAGAALYVAFAAIQGRLLPGTRAAMAPGTEATVPAVAARG